MRYFLRLSYDGTDFAGWQVQPNVTTVQGEIEQALSKLLGRAVPVTGCGRTDRGVHAQDYIAHIDLEPADKYLDQLIYKLNRMLGDSIAIHQIKQMGDRDHARYDATERTYRYDLHFTKNPFVRRYSTYIHYGHKVDIGVLHEVSDLILRTTDFSSFCKAHGSSHNIGIDDQCQ